MRTSNRDLETLEECRRLVAAEDLAAAELRLATLLDTNPENVEASILLGIVRAKTGQHGEASRLLDSALARAPDHLEALTWAAAVRKALGCSEEAIPLVRRVLELRPTDAEAQNLYGSLLLAQGRALEAEEAFRLVLGLVPNSSAGHANLGMALRLQNRGEEALRAFRRACDLAPGQASNHLQVFKQLQRLSRWDEALEALEGGLRRHPASILLAEAMALALGRRGRNKEAEAIFLKIAETGVAANNYAEWLQQAGRFEDSVPVLRNSLRIQPLQGAPYRILVEARQTALDGVSILEKALALAEDPRLDDAARMHLSFAVGRLYERGRDFQAAMAAFDKANEIAYRIYPACRTFDPAWTRREPEQVGDLYSKALLERLAPIGARDPRPVFIVGMIRSGTTLLDQIASSHPEVASVGEGTFWNAEADKIHPRWAGGDPSRSEIASFAEGYLRSVSAPQTTRFTDKMPLNYRNLGLIHAVFPEARFLHLRRSPLDTCLSIYTTFLGGGANFLYRQKNVVAVYRAYLRAMERWRENLPGDRLLEIDYESLVTDPEPATRQIVGFMGLPWDEACLRPEQNPGAIYTPSRWQARQPVYASSIERWRGYEPWLGSLLDLRDATHPPIPDRA